MQSRSAGSPEYLRFWLVIAYRCALRKVSDLETIIQTSCMIAAQESGVVVVLGSDSEMHWDVT